LPNIVIAGTEGESKGYDLCKRLKGHGATAGIPIVLLSGSPNADEEFARHRKDTTRADSYVKMPSPPEDVVDCVERLIGLPAPNGRGTPSQVTSGGSSEVQTLRKEVEELQEQLHFYQKQLDVVSVTGEKEAREMDQLLKDLQEDVEKGRKEKDELREELRLLKGDLTKKDHEVNAKEKMVGDLREQTEKEKSQLQQELNELRAAINDKEEKHKRAQNALREYYKPKVVKVVKLEADLEGMRGELSNTKSELRLIRETAERAVSERDGLKEELEADRQRQKKLQKVLQDASKLFES
jgi:chromosome segregation ATPase